jgi:hypothetical protein
LWALLNKHYPGFISYRVTGLQFVGLFRQNLLVFQHIKNIFKRIAGCGCKVCIRIVLLLIECSALWSEWSILSHNLVLSYFPFRMTGSITICTTFEVDLYTVTAPFFILDNRDGDWSISFWCGASCPSDRFTNFVTILPSIWSCLLAAIAPLLIVFSMMLNS